MIRLPPPRAVLFTFMLAMLSLAPALTAQQQQEPPPEEPAAEQQEAPAEGDPAAETPPSDTAEAPAPAAPALIDVTEVAGRADTASKTLDRIEELLERPAGVKAAAQDLQALGQGMADTVYDARLTLNSTNSLTAVDDVKATWSDFQAQLSKFKVTFDDRAQALKKALTELEELTALWQPSADAFGADAPEAAVSRARSVLDRATEMRERVLASRERVVNEQSLAAETSTSIENVLKDISSTQKRLQRQLLSADAPPLWKAYGEFQPSSTPFLNEWQRRVDSLIAYAKKFRSALITEGVLILAVTILLLVVRRPAKEWVQDDPSMAASLALLRRPLATALLVAIVFRPLIHPQSPMGLGTLHYLLGLVAVYRVLGLLLTGRQLKGLVLVSALFLLDIARGFLWNDPLLERSVFVVEALAGSIALAAFLRIPEPADQRSSKLVRILEWTALGTLIVALFCLTVGYVGMGRLLTRGIIVSAWSGYGFLAMRRALVAVINMGLHTKTMSRLKMVSRHRFAIRQRLNSLVVLVMWLLFIGFVLRVFSIDAAIEEAIVSIVTTPLEKGNLSISLGDVLAFGFVLWLSFQISKFLRFVFQEDIATRLKLPRGVPYAASAALHYVILFIGFIVAVQAAGVDMGRFAIIGGALGVGVGFGLQNVVNNFVSGLILLFERPIQVGDTVEVGTVFGIVGRIGIRSSTVRTWDGAEVIVPNGDLISNQVTNWTLSDMQRRVIIPIGVKYGTDPERVIQLLLDVAKEHPDVISDPAPMAIFTTHGDSSLNFELRAWTVSDSPVRLKSALTTAVNRALAAADIEIPFPQRDLHVRSSDVELGGSGPAAPPPDRPVIPDAMPDDDEHRA